MSIIHWVSGLLKTICSYGEMGSALCFDILKHMHDIAKFSPRASTTPDIVNISRDAFLHYLAVPYVIHFLIIKDRGLDINDPAQADDLIECDTIRLKTSAGGVLLHPLDDTIRDEIFPLIKTYATKRKKRDEQVHFRSSQCRVSHLSLVRKGKGFEAPSTIR